MNDLMLSEIERGERWLAERLAIDVHEAMLMRLRQRLRLELAQTTESAEGPVPGLAPGEVPDRAVVLRVKQAVRAELMELTGAAQRRWRPRVILWGLSWTAAAAVLLLMLLPHRPQRTEDRRLRLESFVSALDRRADDDEQMLNSLAEDLATVEDMSVTLLPGTWDEAPLDELNDDLDELTTDLDSTWDVS
jgi:hypothetical protein